MGYGDTQDPAAVAHRLFNALKTGRSSQLSAVHETLSRSPSTVDGVHLRRLIIDALRAEPTPSPAEAPHGRSVRCFMLSTLGRISGDDAEAISVLRKDLEEDPYDWARYWALEGLVAGKFVDIKAVCKDVRNTEREDLVRMLALAVLAADGDGEALAEVEAQVTGLAAGGQRTRAAWATLRALRSVYLPSTIEDLCRILASSEEPDIVFDVIAALGRVAGTDNLTERVALSLADLLKRLRDAPWMHGVRTRALDLLGRLCVAETESTLFKELMDGDPGIVRTAARALEGLLGTERATGRVVDAATETPHDLTTYVEGLRGMKNAAAVADRLEAIMSEGNGEGPGIARRLLSEIGGTAAFQKLRARTRASSDYLKLLEDAEQRLREMFETSIREARNGFRIAMSMDISVFAFGLVLLGVSGFLAFRANGIAQWAGVGITGGTGLSSALYGTFLARPRRQVQEAVDHLMHLNLVFLGYLRQLHQTDQAYTRRLLDDEPLPPQEVREFTQMVEATMAGAVQRLAPPPRRHGRDVERKAVAHA